MISPRVRIPTAAELARENKRLLRCINAAMDCLNPLRRPEEFLAWARLLDGLEGNEPRKELSEEARQWAIEQTEAARKVKP